MITPIVMLVLMIAPYLVVRVLSVVTHRAFNAEGAGAIGLSLLFIFTGIGHFIETETMVQMLPPWVPKRIRLVYLTGVLEFVIAGGFFVRKSTWFTGWITATITER